MAEKTFPRHLLIASLCATLFSPALIAQQEEADDKDLRADTIRWVQGDFDKALGKAREEQKKIFIYFWADGSAQSGKFYEETLKSEHVTESLTDFVSYSARTNDQAGYDLLQKYGVSVLPASLFVEPDGDVEDAVLGFLTAEGFQTELTRIQEGKYTVSHFREMAADPEDFEAQYKLAIKLQDVGDQEGFQEIVDSIKAADPKGKSETAALLHFADLYTALFAGVQSPQDALSVDMKPMYEFAERAKHRTVRWTAWDRIGNTHYNLGRTLESRKAFRKAVDNAPDNQIIYWGHNIANSAWNMREFLPGDDKKAVLKLAQKALKKAEKAVKTGDDEQETYGFTGPRPFDDPDPFIASRLYTLAGAYFMNEKTGKAIATLKKAEKLEPDNQQIKSRLQQFELIKKK
ncbi:MAG: hypothetical protein ACYTG5_18780 [Planctomycetota bacterium]